MAEREANERIRQQLLALADQYATLAAKLLEGHPVMFPDKH
jgi:hypothetical protein